MLNNLRGAVVQNPLDRSDYYRRKAVTYYELAIARPPFLGDFYRRVAVRYMLMAEEILSDARGRNEINRQTESRAE
jgi:hypothetical protein